MPETALTVIATVGADGAGAAAVGADAAALDAAAAAGTYAAGTAAAGDAALTAGDALTYAGYAGQGLNLAGQLTGNQTLSQIGSGLSLGAGGAGLISGAANAGLVDPSATLGGTASQAGQVQIDPSSSLGGTAAPAANITPEGIPAPNGFGPDPTTVQGIAGAGRPDVPPTSGGSPNFDAGINNAAEPGLASPPGGSNVQNTPFGVVTPAENAAIQQAMNGGGAPYVSPPGGQMLGANLDPNVQGDMVGAAASNGQTATGGSDTVGNITPTDTSDHPGPIDHVLQFAKDNPVVAKAALQTAGGALTGVGSALAQERKAALDLQAKKELAQWQRDFTDSGQYTGALPIAPNQQIQQGLIARAQRKA